jgi:6-phosphofructokinase 1
VLATRFGVEAVAAVHDGDTGTMVALQAGQIVRVPLAEAVGHPKSLDRTLLDRVVSPLLG